MSWSTSELRVRLARRETGFNPPVKYFADRSGALLLLWIFYVLVLSCVCYVFVHVCLCVLCGHLLGKGWPLGSRLWCLTVSLSLSHWCPGSGVELDCIHPDLCTLTYFKAFKMMYFHKNYFDMFCYMQIIYKFRNNLKIWYLLLWPTWKISCLKARTPFLAG